MARLRAVGGIALVAALLGAGAHAARGDARGVGPPTTVAVKRMLRTIPPLVPVASLPQGHRARHHRRMARRSPPIRRASVPSAALRAYGAARSIDAVHYPYQSGGGHGTVSGPYDCSGAVSAVLRQAGLLDATMVSGAFAGYGEPGPGRYVSIYANAGHVYMSFTISGAVRYWGTSYENPGGGAGFHSPRSGSGFVVRHPPGL